MSDDSEKIAQLEEKIISIEKENARLNDILKELIFFFVEHNNNYDSESRTDLFHDTIAIYKSEEDAITSLKNPKSRLKEYKNKAYEKSMERMSMSLLSGPESLDEDDLERMDRFGKGVMRISQYIMPIYENVKAQKFEEGEKLKEKVSKTEEAQKDKRERELIKIREKEDQFFKKKERFKRELELEENELKRMQEYYEKM